MDTDQPSAALIKDLKQRGMLDDTLVVWGGEFGRTVYSQGEQSMTSYGRDHHPRCFTIWAAGGGIKPGMTYGKTDDYGYNVTENPVSVHDLHATLLHLLGFDHTKLSMRFQGLNMRLTGVAGELVPKLLA
jgi:arylsulfatase A-like enzyme